VAAPADVCPRRVTVWNTVRIRSLHGVLGSSKVLRSEHKKTTEQEYKVPSLVSSIDTIIVTTMGEGPFWFLTLAITLVQ